MVLHVEFNHLAEEVQRHGLKPWAYVAGSGAQTVVTVGDPASQLLLQAESSLWPEEVVKRLTHQGLLVAHGRWLPDPQAGEIHVAELLWVASVAYRSSEERPGLWVNAYQGPPSVGDVLRDFHSEMAAEAQLEGVSMEEFIAAAAPTVVVLSPDELQAFASRHFAPC